MNRNARNDIESAARAAAAQLLMHCFPLLLVDMVRRAHPISFHQFHLLPEDGGALAPGLVEDDTSTVASSAWIDLVEQPVLLSLPDTQGRHFNLTLFDTAGEPFASIVSRSGGDTGVNLAVVGPRWRGELPRGLTAKRAPSDRVWAISRIQAHCALDRADAVAIARQLQVSWLRPDIHRQRRASAMLEPPSSPCLRQAMEIDAATFFHRLEAILDRAPQPYRTAVLREVTALRNELGGPPMSSEWSADFARALASGLADGAAAIQAAAEACAEAERSGWRTTRRLESDPVSALGRAANAYAGMGARMPDDRLALVCDHDESGRPLSGADSYRIRFPSDGLPPAQSCWWLSTRPIATFDQRHGLGHRSQLTRSPSGSLDVIVRRAPPGGVGIPNWLPAPDGPFSLVMRLYRPHRAALTGDWTMPPVERLGSGWEPREGGRSLPTLETPGPICTANDFAAPASWRTTP